MKFWIRRFLGIDALEMHMHQQQNQLNSIYDEIVGTRNDVTLLFTVEFDEKRKELSDKIGAEAIRRANAEVKARALTGGQDY